MPADHSPAPPPKPLPAPQPRSAITTYSLWIASAALTVMMLTVVGDVVLRAAFNTPVQGAYDVVSITLLIMVAFGIGPVIVRRGEILIDLIDGIIGAKAVRILGAIGSLLSFAVITFIGWSMISPAQDAWQWGGYSLELGVPQWILWALAFAGLAGVLWAAVLQVIGFARGQEGQR
ncbi:TRAP transporter small permease [Pararhodobacter oceanensis]|uniref:TRAP transporter small permease protein n=1 Tax=Pararhodobacter oceanensis TaxID=2172121 RepID=A0A2T8HQ00_9RHOB|nr:TRAP transporter small permease subunit [Pararhodobacter oceanensis]PVH27528.1 hypothetical protein DDE20_17320 [Pararhodobacter oceanensis]